MPQVSIIVPVYNAETNLNRCLTSILNQEFRDFELLCIDDGSTDLSGSILDDYAARDSRVRVVHKENTGVSDSRNTALDMAKGTYVQFVDADDWIAASSTKVMVRAMEQRQCDMVIADFYRVIGRKIAKKGNIFTTRTLSLQEYAECMMDSPADFYYGVLWNKMYRLDLIRRHRLHMERRISWCEDFIFNLDYLVFSKTIAALQVPVYYYVKTEGSLVEGNLKLADTVKMKTTVYQYYDRFFRNVLDEEEYRRTRPQIAAFLLAAASDGTVLPFAPGTQDLGTENVPVYFSGSGSDSILSMSYYLQKVLDRQLLPVAQNYGLDLKDVRVLLALKEKNHVTSQKEIADFTGYSQMTVLACLEHLIARHYVRRGTSRDGAAARINYDNSAAILQDLDAALQDLASLCLQGFSATEEQQVVADSARICRNLKDALKKQG